jgi:ribosomal protein S18 acetylase RimI-like enzyme
MGGDVISRHQFVVKCASTVHELKEAKSLDDTAFGAHHGVTLDELEKIIKVGKLILLREAGSGKLVGETQLIFEPIDELPYSFAHPVGFCYGTAIDPAFQGHGLGKILAMEQEKAARESGKKELHLTVRVENYASLRMRTGLGYRIIAYRESFYGPSPANDARVIMSKVLDGNVGGEAVKGAVKVDFDGAYNARTHHFIRDFLKLGYRGVAVDRKRGILFA